MKTSWPWLAILAGGTLLLVSCGKKKFPTDLNDTAQPVGVPDPSDGTHTVKVSDVAMSKGGILFLKANSLPFSGLVNDVWPDGKMKYSCAYKDGKKDGPELAFYEDGSKRLAAQYKMNNKEGQAQEWWPGGQMKSMMTFLNGKPQGEAKGWHKNGKPARVEKYEGGVKAGKSEGWWEDGKQADQTTFANGKPQGWKIKWHRNGQTNSMVFFSKGVKQGPSTTWYDNGQRGQFVSFANGQPNGDMIEWHRNGQQMTLEKWVNGKQHGAGAGWYADGKVKWQGMWQNGERHGQFIGYYSNGVKRLQISYNAGIRQRKTSFNIQGQVTEDIVTPRGRTLHWTMDQLSNLNQFKKQITDLFGRPDAIAGSVWTYNGIMATMDRKVMKVSIRVMFDPTGSRCQVSVQQPGALGDGYGRPNIGGPPPRN